ncbi:MAG TPA: DUF2986 domain-containing protein, partial [Thiomicrospira sp.]|nr:DUF2986 domain-containing protein [Thiomicrospira sp.]
MNRQKKIRQKFEKKLKRAKAKRFPKNKEPYISKADRLKNEENNQTDIESGVKNSHDSSENSEDKG